MFELNVVLERCEATAGLSEAAVPALVRPAAQLADLPPDEVTHHQTLF